MTSRYKSPSTIVRSLFTGAALVALVFTLSGCGKSEKAAAAKAPAGKDALQSVEQKVSYGIGYNFGADVARQVGLKVDQEAIRAGLTDGLTGAKTRLTEAEIQAAFAVMKEKVAAELAKAGAANLVAAQAFMDKNRTRAGVKTALSGLQYEVLKSGEGKKPKSTDTVEVHYHGTLVDGLIFDSSVERGQTIQFQVTGVIPGWVEALQLMSVGDKWKLYIPPALGYGPRGSGKIPPNSALIFEVELISIK